MGLRENEEHFGLRGRVDNEDFRLGEALGTSLVAD
jgi:hypothetical protein